MTELERIQTMSSQKLAEELYMNYIRDCNQCPCDKYNYKKCYSDNCDCITMIEKWLNSKCE